MKSNQMKSNQMKSNKMKSNKMKRNFKKNQLNVDKFLFNIRKKIIQNQKMSI